MNVSCLDCDHHLGGPAGEWCSLYGEDLLYDAADGCDGYQAAR